MATKDRFLQIRVNPAEKAAIQQQAARAGMDMSSYVLACALPAARAAFAELAAELRTKGPQRRFVFASLHDFLAAAGREEFIRATTEPPATELEPYAANYLAAMVETTAHRLGLPAPPWTRDISPLQAPVFGSSLPGLRLHLLTQSPPAFRRRNIFIDSTIGSRV